jgi:hypothetical protein
MFDGPFADPNPNHANFRDSRDGLFFLGSKLGALLLLTFLPIYKAFPNLEDDSSCLVSQA